jgi:sodium/potassium-transporting ATPase subunit beta
MSNVKERRGTVVEEAAEGLLLEGKEQRLQQNQKKKTFQSRIKDFGTSIYNPKYREFVSRDGKDCCLLSFFYFVFYTLLSGFFVLMLTAFHSTLDPKIPTYYDKTSVMNHNGVNPGLGFRPQYNPENNLIMVNTSNVGQWKEELVKSIDVFLDKYEEDKEKEIIINPLKPDAKVSFAYSDIINNTPCSRANEFGYKASTPCVIVKINRIFGWKPKAFDEIPKELNVTITQEMKDAANATKFLYIKCEGEHPFDKDNTGKIDYYSQFPSKEIGGVPVTYFPYKNQKDYLSPLVFVHFKEITKNALVNIKCRLWAKNVDNTDNRNQRGMVSFEIYVAK